MQHSKIEWCNYSINPVKGLCPMACPYCYARRMYKRFKWNPEIRLDKTVPLHGFPATSKVFVGSTIELFGDWIREEWLKYIFAQVRQSPDITFIFLTKRPWELHKYNPWPDNVWVGATAWDRTSTAHALYGGGGLTTTQAKVKFISFEPLLGETKIDFRDFEWAGINYVIIGQQTPVIKKTAPKIEWVKEIALAADEAGIPVFLKNNLKRLLLDFECQWAYKDGYYTSPEHPDVDRHFRQEFPKPEDLDLLARGEMPQVGRMLE